MNIQKCKNCGDRFRPQRNPSQKYCSKKKCQRKRKTLWQRIRRNSDPDYRENDQRANRDWQGRKKGYYKNYRCLNPNYAQRNREETAARYHAKAHLQKSLPKGKAPQLRGLYKITLLSDSASVAVREQETHTAKIEPFQEG